MFILSLSCDAPEFLNAIVLIKTLLVILQVMAPIILVIISGMDIIKAVTAGNQDEIMKNVHKIPKRLLSLAIVYLVPIVINMTVTIAQDISEYSECYKKATPENVTIAYSNKAEELVVTAEKELTRKTLSTAQGYLVRLKGRNLDSLIDSLTKRLDTVEKAIKLKEEEDNDNNEYVSDSNPSNSGYKNSYGAISNPQGLPYYNQGDPQYSSYTVNGVYFNLQNNGCGYVSFAMIAAGLKKDPSIIPQRVLDKYFHGSNSYLGTAPFTNGTFAKKFGLKYKSVFDSGAGATSSQQQEVINELKKGHPCVVLVPHHYIVFAGIKNDKIYILDPGNWQKNGTYTMNQFYSKYAQSGYTTFGMAVCYYK